jgi:hypothetical protein
MLQLGVSISVYFFQVWYSQTFTRSKYLTTEINKQWERHTTKENVYSVTSEKIKKSMF